jgi:hypothetical protein
MATLVVLNEQHTLSPQQKELLDKKFQGWEPFLVPAAGWTKKRIEELSRNNLDRRVETQDAIVFASPIPLLISRLVHEVAFSNFHQSPMWGVSVWLFHNDQREKKELPNGKTIQVVAQEGWEVVKVAGF